MNEEIEVLFLEDVLKMCVDNFNCLWYLMFNYNGFKEDVKGVNVMDKVLMFYVLVWFMVLFEVCMWLKLIYR